MTWKFIFAHFTNQASDLLTINVLGGFPLSSVSCLSVMKPGYYRLGCLMEGRKNFRCTFLVVYFQGITCYRRRALFLRNFPSFTKSCLWVFPVVLSPQMVQRFRLCNMKSFLLIFFPCNQSLPWWQHFHKISSTENGMKYIASSEKGLVEVIEQVMHIYFLD